MDVYDWEFLKSGRPSAVISMLNRILGQYARWYGPVYIGVTGDTAYAQREYTHAREGWDEMVYLYATSSRDYAYEMERVLIDHCHNQGYSVNLISGGGGLGWCGEYYIYVLLMTA